MKNVILAVLSFISFTLSAQLINMGDVVISSGTTLYISGIDFKNDNGTTHLWSNNGTFVFKGDNFTNDGTMDENAAGTTEFSGVNEQNIDGSSIAYFHNLNINNANASVVQHNTVDTDNMNINDGAVDFDYKVLDTVLYVRDAMSVNGDVRLTGAAQLVQTHTGASLNSGNKYIWLDQQGTANQYWYNYWSAPVSRNGEWKLMYLRDGATGDDILQSSFPEVQMAYNSNVTNDLPAQTAHPVYLNSYWMWAFRNGADGTYDGWVHVKHNGALIPGEGYTMKGPGVDKDLNAANGTNPPDYESWTFSGLPNDGDYTISIDVGNDYLIGNPYPSALDADAFIKDNISTANGGNNTNDIFNGTLYFWEHTGGTNHYGANYEGGYATYTLTGGVAATSWADSNTTVGTKVPKQFIPVGQGFTVWSGNDNGNADIEGGNIIFKNSQRVFQKEGDNSIFIRPVAQTNIRLGFDTPLNYHAQLLLGVRPNTTNGIDIGWDGPSFNSDFPGADVRWLLQTDQVYTIQAVPEINIDSQFPLQVVVSDEGLVNFQIDMAENLPAGITDVYIKDNLNDTYHSIFNGNSYEVFLQSDTYNDRFSVVFRDPNLSSSEQLQLENIASYFDQQSKELVILNSKQQNIDLIKLFALTGQEVLTQNKVTHAAEIRIPVRLTTGVYLLKVRSDDRSVYTAKMIIK